MKTVALHAALVAVLVVAASAGALANGAMMPQPETYVVPESAPVPEAQPAEPGAGPVLPTPAAPTAEPERAWNQCDLATMTVAQAWEASGRDYAVFNDMVRSMVGLSAQNRGLSLPDSNEAGREIGCMIRQRAEADPNQLLYVVVDDSVRGYATAHNLQPAA